jgi:hypothetical protein
MKQNTKGLERSGLLYRRLPSGKPDSNQWGTVARALRALEFHAPAVPDHLLLCACYKIQHVRNGKLAYAHSPGTVEQAGSSATAARHLSRPGC